MDAYTKITVTIQYPDVKREYTVQSDAWDLNAEDFAQMVRQIMAAVGYAEKTISEVFNDPSNVVD